MFFTIALIILGFVSILTIHNWLKNRFIFSSKLTQKKIKKISQSLSLQNWEKSEKELAHLLKKGRDNKEIQLLQIQLLKGKGLLNAALEKAYHAGRLFPEELGFRLEEGQILLDLNLAKEALDAFEVCAPILRTETDYFYVARALKQTGRPLECLEVLAPLLKQTNNGGLAALAGDALYDCKQFPEAILHYKHALALGLETQHVKIQLGHAFRRQGNLAEAEKIFRSLLEKDSQSVDATLGLGACLQERGYHHKALFVYQSLLSTKDLRLLTQAGFAALRAQRYSFAEKYFCELMHLRRADPQTLGYYGFCLENQKKWQEAEQVYLKLLQLFPDDYQGYRALAWMFGTGLSQTISQTHGMDFAYRALKLKNDPTSWEILSACAARTGEFERAYQIQLTLSKQDSDPQTRIRRSQILRTLRKRMPLGDTHILRSEVA